MQLTLLRVSSKEPMVFLQYNTDVPQLWSLSDFTCVHLDKNIWGNEGRRKSESLVSSVQGNTCTPRHTIEQHLSISSLYAFFVSSMYLWKEVSVLHMDREILACLKEKEVLIGVCYLIFSFLSLIFHRATLKNIPTLISL